MTKAELIERVAKDLGPGITKKKVSQAVDSVFTHLYKGIRKDKHFTYPGFGTWRIKKRQARKGRNPKTGEVIKIKTKKAVRFRAGKQLDYAINR